MKTTKSILDVFALRVHIGLAHRKWVNIGGFKITKAMIDETVCGFIRAHSVKNVLDGRVLRKTPIVFGDGRRLLMLPYSQQFD